MNIVLLGFMGTGKSTVGKYLAEKLGRIFVELDKEIEVSAGMSIPAIFNNYGEEHFRDLETAEIRKWCRQDNLVIATGGGAVVRSQNRAYLKENGLLVCLKATPEAILERIKYDRNRPLLNVPDKLAKIKELMALRKQIYQEAADYTLDCSELSSMQVVEHIIGYVRGWNDGKIAGSTGKK
ncbi:MAG: shikimate kinase [bacterium]